MAARASASVAYVNRDLETAFLRFGDRGLEGLEFQPGHGTSREAGFEDELHEIDVEASEVFDRVARFVGVSSPGG